MTGRYEKGMNRVNDTRIRSTLLLPFSSRLVSFIPVLSRHSTRFTTFMLRSIPFRTR